jgi:hypothetical protein
MPTNNHANDDQQRELTRPGHHRAQLRCRPLPPRHRIGNDAEPGPGFGGVPATLEGDLTAGGMPAAATDGGSGGVRGGAGPRCP